jgi:hypothetical protein
MTAPILEQLGIVAGRENLDADIWGWCDWFLESMQRPVRVKPHHIRNLDTFDDFQRWTLEGHVEGLLQ